MLALSAVGAGVLIIVVSLTVAISAMGVVYALNEFRIWKLRRRGLDRCRFCGTLLKTVVNNLDMPVGFMSVCPGCGRDQGPWDERRRLQEL